MIHVNVEARIAVVDDISGAVVEDEWPLGEDTGTRHSQVVVEYGRTRSANGQTERVLPNA